MATLTWMRDHGDLLREIVRDDLAEAADLTPGGRSQHPRAPALRGDGPARDPRAALRRRPRGLRRRAAGVVRREPAPVRRAPRDRRRRDRAGGAPPVRHLPRAPTPRSTRAWSAACGSAAGSGSSCSGSSPTSGPAADGFSDEVLAHMGAHQRELARLIFSLDLQAKNAAREAAGGGGGRRDPGPDRPGGRGAGAHAAAGRVDRGGDLPGAPGVARAPADGVADGVDPGADRPIHGWVDDRDLTPTTVPRASAPWTRWSIRASSTGCPR